ncbi:MAG: hypothetical protein INR71_14320 [Terriglobus roseus]|nr:hypothetical protein [Terriglobus roseus]
MQELEPGVDGLSVEHGARNSESSSRDQASSDACSAHPPPLSLKSQQSRRALEEGPGTAKRVVERVSHDVKSTAVR